MLNIICVFVYLFGIIIASESTTNFNILWILCGKYYIPWGNYWWNLYSRYIYIFICIFIIMKPQNLLFTTSKLNHSNTFLTFCQISSICCIFLAMMLKSKNWIYIAQLCILIIWWNSIIKFIGNLHVNLIFILIQVRVVSVNDVLTTNV